MRRSASLQIVTMSSAFVLGLLANSSCAEAKGGNCQAKLAGNSYDCAYKFSNGTDGADCLDFYTMGDSQNFDVDTNSFDSFGCACRATGSFKSPAFDASSNGFACVADDVELDGKLKSNKLSGEVVDQDGESLVFTCEKRSTPCF
jgi:hypothetical protein